MSQNVSECKRCFNVKSSTFHFHVKTKISADFQICIRVILNDTFRSRPATVFLEKDALKICRAFIGEHPIRSMILIKLP